MSLRAKILLLFCGTLAALVVMLYAVTRTIMLGGFSRLEKEHMARNAARAREMLAREAEDLDGVARDWALWDETYDFARGGNRDFVRRNLNAVAVCALRINALVIADAAGSVMYETGFDEAAGRFTPLSTALREALARNRAFLMQRSAPGFARGVLCLPGGPVLIAARPILRGDGSGAVGGTLLMARDLDAGRLGRLSRTLHLAIGVYCPGDPRTPPEVRAARASLREGEGVLTSPLDARTVAAYALVRDIRGRAGPIVRVERPRDIVMLGRTALRYSIVSYIAIALMLAVSITVLLHRAVLSRLKQLSSGVDHIGTSGDIASRVTLKGKDELARLASSINGMLVALENSQLEVRRSEENYRTLFENMLSGFALHRIVLDERGRPVDFIFLEVNAPFERFTRLSRSRIIGKRATEVMPGITRSDFDWMGLYGKVAMTGETARVERYSDFLGGWYSISAYSPRKGCFAVVFDDITDRKLAEQALRESERRQKALLDNIPDIAWFKDREGRFIAVNEPFGKACGRRPEELAGKTDLDVWPMHLAERYRADDAEVMRTGVRKRIEEPLVDAAGNRTWLETIKTPIFDDAGIVVGTTGISRDITERKQAEKKMDHLARVLRALRSVDQLITREKDRARMLKGACDALISHRGYYNAWIALKDETGGLSAVAECGIGERFSRFAGKMSQGAWAECALKALKEQRMVTVAAALSGCAGCPLEAGCRGRAAMIVRLEYGGVIFGVIAVSVPGDVAADEEECSLFGELARDVSFALYGIEMEERRRAVEEALRESEERYRTLLANIPVGLYRNTAGPEGKFLMCNQAIVRMFGYASPEEFMQCRVSDLYADPAEREKFSSMLLERGRADNVELRLKKKDGTPIWGSVSASVVRESGSAAYFDGMIEDISARKRAEEALRKTTEDLRRSNQDLEQFACVASHDLQEPLRMVTSYLQLLKRRCGTSLDATAAEYVSCAVEGAARMKLLINDLLEYSRVGTSERPFEETDAGAALGRALSNLEVSIAESGAVVTREPLPAVTADGKQLEQLFQNLVGNAVKFRSAALPRVHVSARREAGEWLFSVRDNGIGIDPRFSGRIFEIFQRLHGRNEYPGTGIGLALCRRIVERHGGRIWVESRPGKGAAFYFTLPAKGAAQG